MSEPNALASRVSKLEMEAAHIHRLYDQLNEVVTEQATLIDRLKRRVNYLEEQLAAVKVKSDSPVDPYDEKPPHY